MNFDVLRSDRYRVLASETGEVKLCDPVTFAILYQFQLPTDDESLFDVLLAYFRPTVVSEPETTLDVPMPNVKQIGRRRKRS